MPKDLKTKLIYEFKYNIYILIYSFIVSSIVYSFEKFTTSYSIVFICTLLMIIISRYLYNFIEFSYKKLMRKSTD